MLYCRTYTYDDAAQTLSYLSDDPIRIRQGLLLLALLPPISLESSFQICVPPGVTLTPLPLTVRVQVRVCMGI